MNSENRELTDIVKRYPPTLAGAREYFVAGAQLFIIAAGLSYIACNGPVFGQRPPTSARVIDGVAAVGFAYGGGEAFKKCKEALDRYNRK